MCIIIQAKEDIYPDGIAITHTSLNRAGSTVGSVSMAFAFTERKS
jgi:hypothetical protein